MPTISAGPARAEGRRLSWAVVVLTLAAITSSSLSALSLYHVLALQAEVEGLRTEVSRRREEQRSAPEESVSGPQRQQQEEDRKKAEVRVILWKKRAMPVSEVGSGDTLPCLPITVVLREEQNTHPLKHWSAAHKDQQCKINTDSKVYLRLSKTLLSLRYTLKQ